MHKLIFPFFTIILISGCVSFAKRPLSPQSLVELKNQTITYTIREKPDFSSMKPEKAGFALLGVTAIISEGNKIVFANDVPDPAEEIAVGLARKMEGAYGMVFVDLGVKVQSDDVAQILSAIKAPVRYVIDVKTNSWNIGYFPTDWTHYRVTYSAKARLIDAQNKSVLAEGFCKYIPEGSINASKYDELIDHQAAGLKARLKIYAQECLELIKAQMLTEQPG